jgi:hypothetical protein
MAPENHLLLTAAARRASGFTGVEESGWWRWILQESLRSYITSADDA